MGTHPAHYLFSLLAKRMRLSLAPFYLWEKKGLLPVHVVNGDKVVKASIARPLIQVWRTTCTRAEFARLTGWNKNSIGYLINRRLIHARKVHGRWRPCRSSIPVARRLASQHMRQVKRMSQGNFFVQLAGRPQELQGQTQNLSVTAQYLGVGTSMVHVWISEGKLKVTYYRGRLVVFTSSIKSLRKRFLVEFKNDY